MVWTNQRPGIWRGLRHLTALGVCLLLLSSVVAQPNWLPPGAVLTPPPGAIVVSSRGAAQQPVGASSLRPAGDLDTSAPVVTIRISAPAASRPAQEIPYRVLAQNPSRADAHHVFVKVAVAKSGKVVRSSPEADTASPEGAPPEKATVLTWDLGTLAPGSRKEMSFFVEPTADEDVTCCARVQFEHGQCVRTRINKAAPPAAVARAKGNPPKRDSGINRQPPLAKELEKSPDDIPAKPPVEAPLKPLGQIPGETPPNPPVEAPVKPPVEAAVKPPTDPPINPVVEVPVKPSVETPAEAPVKPAVEKPAKPIAEGKAVLQLRIVAAGKSPRDDPTPYRLEVTNSGTAPAREVVLEALPDKALTFFNSKPAVTGIPPYVWKLDEIAPGGKKTVEFDLAGHELGTFTTRAVVKAAGDLIQEARQSVSIIEAKARLDVVVSGPSVRAVDRDATYRITVRNVGDKPATAVEVTDEPIKDEKNKDIDAIKRVSVPGGTKDARSAKWVLGEIAPGTEKTVQIVLRAAVASDPNKPFTYVCTARAAGNLIEQGFTKTRFVEAGVLDVEINQYSGPAGIKAGKDVHYVVLVRNGGTVVNNKVDVQISLPPGLEARNADGSRPVNPSTIRLAQLPSLPAEGKAHEMILRATRPGSYKLTVLVSSNETKTTGPVRAEETIIFEK